MTPSKGARISTKRTIVRNTAANVVAQLAQMASAFVFMPFLIARFGLNDYGLYLLVASLTGYLGLLDMGVGASLVKYVAEHRARDERKELSETVSTALVFYAIIGLAAAGIMLLIAFFGIALFKLPEASQHLARNLFLVGSVTALATWPLSTANYVLAGHQRYDLSARLTVLATIANIVATAAVLAVGQGPLVLLVATSTVGLAVALLSARFAIREMGETRVGWEFATWSRMKRIFRFSSVVFVAQIASVLIYQQTDRLVLGVFVGTSAIALYEAAQKLHSLVRQFAGLTASAVLPTASQLDAEGRHDTLIQLFLRGTKYTVIAVTPIVVAIIALAQPLLREWLGPEFVVMTFGAQLFVSYWLLNANMTVVGGILLGTDKLRLVLWYTIAMTISNVTLSVILVNVIGINGVIVGTVAPAYVGFPIYMYSVSKVLDFRLSEWWRQVVVPTYPFLLLTAIVAVGGRAIGLTDTLVEVVLLGAASVGIYWLAVYLFGLTPTERAEARAAGAAVRRAIGLASS